MPEDTLPGTANTMPPGPDLADINPGARKILIVDDERVVADTLALILQHAGYNSWAFYSAEAALAVSHWSPDLAIVDVDLPGIHGLDLALHLRRLCPDCHILILSGHLSTADLLQQLQLEGHRFDAHPKPIQPGHLLNLVSERLGPPIATATPAPMPGS